MEAFDALALLIFGIVGAVVSLDVAGLTLAKSEVFIAQREGTGSAPELNKAAIRSWSLKNAGWHAGLLFLYLGMLGWLLDTLQLVALSDKLKQIIADVFTYIAAMLRIEVDVGPYVRDVLDSLGSHASIILSFVALFIVWSTYSDKIVDRPISGERERLPPLARAAYGLVKAVYRLLHRGARLTEAEAREVLAQHAQAALVAIDMLALATLMKSMRYTETTHHQIMLVGIVFVTVFGITYATATYGARLFARVQTQTSSEASSRLLHEFNWLRVTLRILEPWLIFYFTLELFSYMIFRERTHSVGFVFGATLLLFALLKKHSFAEVVDAALSGSTSQQEDVDTSGSDFGPMLRLAIICMIATAGLTVYLIAIGLWRYQPFHSLDSLLSHGLAGLLCLAGFIRFAAPFRAKDDAVDRVGRKLSKWIDLTYKALIANAGVSLFALGAVFIASTVPVIDKLLATDADMLFRAGDDVWRSLRDLGFNGNHVHAAQIAAWLLMLFLVGAMVRWADHRWERRTTAMQATEAKPLSDVAHDHESRSTNRVAAVMIVLGAVTSQMPHLQDRLKDWADRLDDVGTIHSVAAIPVVKVEGAPYEHPKGRVVPVLHIERPSGNDLRPENQGETFVGFAPLNGAPADSKDYKRERLSPTYGLETWISRTMSQRDATWKRGQHEQVIMVLDQRARVKAIMTALRLLRRAGVSRIVFGIRLSDNDRFGIAHMPNPSSACHPHRLKRWTKEGGVVFSIGDDVLDQIELVERTDIRNAACIRLKVPEDELDTLEWGQVVEEMETVGLIGRFTLVDV